MKELLGYLLCIWHRIWCFPFGQYEFFDIAPFSLKWALMHDLRWCFSWGVCTDTRFVILLLSFIIFIILSGFLNSPPAGAAPAPVVPSMPLKAKRKLGKKRAQAWWVIVFSSLLYLRKLHWMTRSRLWHPFTNSARTDNLTLCHWIRATDKDNTGAWWNGFTKGVDDEIVVVYSFCFLHF